MSFYVVYDPKTGAAVSMGSTPALPETLFVKALAQVELDSPPPAGWAWNPLTLAFDPPPPVPPEDIERALLYVKLDQVRDALLQADAADLLALRSRIDELAGAVGLDPVPVVARE